MHDVPSRRRLDSWKEIARYLGRNVRTVSRWERERGLPVHCVPGGRLRTIYAFTDELDAWLAAAGDLEAEADEPAVVGAGANTADRLSRPRIVIAAAGAAVLLVTGWSIAAMMRPAPIALATTITDANAIAAITSEGQVAWRYTPDPSLINLREGRVWSAIGTVDEEPGDDLVVAGTGGWETPEALLAFGNRGRLLWTRALDDEITIGAQTFAPPWRTSAVLLFDAAGSRRVAWLVHHHTWWPSMLVTFDASGRRLDRYVHHGWLTAVRAHPNGRWLLAVGVNDVRDAPVLVALDPASLGGPPLGYATLPRPELARAAGLPLFTSLESPKLHVLPNGSIEVRVLFEPPGSDAALAIYEFDPDLALIRAGVSDSYWGWHRRLEAPGRIDHSDATCPERRGLTIKWISGPPQARAAAK